MASPVVGWARTHWKAVLVGLLALLLLGWGGCAAYGAAVRWSAANDAKIKAAVDRGDSALAVIKPAQARIRKLEADSAALAQRVAQLQHEAAAANAAKVAAQRATLVLRQQLGKPQTVRDSTYQTVIDSLDSALRFAASAARADSERIMRLTHDRDGWQVAALHADSALTKAGSAIGGLQDAAQPERCLFGLVKCPSRTAIALISVGFGMVVGVVADEVIHKRIQSPIAGRVAELHDCPITIPLIGPGGPASDGAPCR